MLPRALIALTVAAALLAGCGGTDLITAPSQPEPLANPHVRAFRQKSFSTSVPAGWHQRKGPDRTGTIYFLNSGPGHANDYGLAEPGEIGLTIARQRAEAGQSATDALARIAATPDGAVGVERSKPIKPTALDGAEAATTQFTYTYGGVEYVQSNMVSIYRGVLVFIEVDSQPYDATEAERTMATVTQRWRWKRSADSVVS